MVRHLINRLLAIFAALAIFCTLTVCPMTVCPVKAEPTDLSRSRAAHRLLAAKCFTCHGPDEEVREAELRLDTFEGSTEELPSGFAAVVPGTPEASELLRRIESDDEDMRMPPANAGEALTAAEKSLLREWIKSGATYPPHWAFAPLDTTIPGEPSDHSDWNRTSVDRYVSAQLAANGLDAPPVADRYTLIRRLYFDLLGLPPSPVAVEQFVTDDSPDAWARLVDSLLASPHYGERWGRHWLDVARYGDSNGGDENHAYPHAYHYRDYVIQTFNADVSYDRFLLEQLAGDLISNDADSEAATAATGFLAIGMKILAEQDPIKKQADMIDEQIDTMGRSLLGLTLGCARCHDHKFDPVSTEDYYALFGIFQSTVVEDREVNSSDLQERLAKYERKINELKQSREKATKKLNSLSSIISRQAESFDRGNVIKDDDQYGAGIGIISDPGGQDNFVEYDLAIQQPGKYRLQLRYAANVARPGQILWNGEIVAENAISEATGGWTPEFQQWHSEADIELAAGEHILRMQSRPLMSHIDQFRLIPVASTDTASALVARLDEIAEQISELTGARPQGVQVMAVREGEAANAKVHLRGSHLSKGDEVPRRFLEVLSRDEQIAIPPEQSGRRQLAEWLTTPESLATRLTARVMANRIWHWHFGRGLVATPDQFGIKSSPPTHPQLLDHLADTFVRNQWSIKSLHREILLSSTYRSSSQVDNANAMKADPENRWYWRANRRRLEAELIRDSILYHADRLDYRQFGAPVQVQSQDPSPDDLRNNRQTYYAARRRSVYLPVVRTNVFKFFTLFDFPNAASPVGRRSRTTVPTQSLWLMNSPFIMEHASEVESRIADSANKRERLEELYWHLFGRPIDDATRVRLERFLEQASAASRSDADGPSAWTLLCHSLLMSDRYIYID